MSQLRKDLHRRIDDRLYQWCTDSGQLYEMAGLHQREGVIDICFCLITALAAVSISLDMSPALLTKAIRESYETMMKAKANEESGS